MRTESRFEQYDLNITLPSPLIARCDRCTLTERISARGRVLVAPDPAEIQALVDIIGHRQYESVAIGFLHSYLNGSHECLVREALRRELPDVDVSISSEVSPQMREYERFNTVCANAYVKPAMKSYLDRLVVSLEQAGVCCSLFMMHSGGGIISVDTAAAFPVRLIESGAVGWMGGSGGGVLDGFNCVVGGRYYVWSDGCRVSWDAARLRTGRVSDRGGEDRAPLGSGFCRFHRYVRHHSKNMSN